jgi:hypothetical protein
LQVFGRVGRPRRKLFLGQVCAATKLCHGVAHDTECPLQCLPLIASPRDAPRFPSLSGPRHAGTVSEGARR